MPVIMSAWGFHKVSLVSRAFINRFVDASVLRLPTAPEAGYARLRIKEKF